MGGCGFLIGQAIGRWGNFVNQEAYGAPTAGNLPLGMTGNVIKIDPIVEALNKVSGVLEEIQGTLNDLTGNLLYKIGAEDE